jgi:activator of HSP90 ATPase
MTEPIHHEVIFRATPDDVYDELVDADRFAAFTGAAATLDAVEGGAFSLFGGQVLGRNLDLVAGSRVVQAWRIAGWPDGVYSIVRFELAADPSGTRLTLDHAGFPDAQRGDIESGWPKMYFEPMARHLAAR